MHMYTDVLVYAPPRVRPRVWLCEHASADARLSSVCTHARACMHACMGNVHRAHSARASLRTTWSLSSLYECIYIYIYVNICVYVCVYIYIYIDR